MYVLFWEAREVYVPLWEASYEALSHPGRLVMRLFHTLGGYTPCTYPSGRLYPVYIPLREARRGSQDR